MSAAESPPFQFRLDLASGVPVYRQIIDQILGAHRLGRAQRRRPAADRPTARGGPLHQPQHRGPRLPGTRDSRRAVSTQQGTGTFITRDQVEPDEAERQRQLSQLVGEFMARAGAPGFTADDVLDRIEEFVS